MPSWADLHQPTILELMAPKWRSAWARFRQRPEKVPRGRGVLLAVAAICFLAVAFGISWRTVKYLHAVPEIGSLLAGKLLGMAFLAFGSILLLSNLIAALSTFFLAKDLDMLMAAPLDWGRVYIAKLIETIIHSSWMVALLMMPLLTAYWIAWDGGPFFGLVVLGALIPFFIIPGVVGTAVTMVLVNVFPARRARDVLGLATILAGGALVVFLRMLRPEELARPEGYQSLVDFIAVLRTPSHPLLPSEWASAMLMNWLTRIGDPLPIALLWTTAGAFVIWGATLHKRLHTSGFARAQEGANTANQGVASPVMLRRLLRHAKPLTREFILKDVSVFLRDSTQWSQLILLVVLVAVYLYNVQSLPLFTGQRVSPVLVTLIVFLNQGLTGFVIAAVAARLIFPAVSLEGRLLWLLRSSPLNPVTMLRSKYLVGMLPLLILALVLTIATNLLLHVTGFMMGVSIFTVICYTLAVGALALGVGTVYPQFDTENAAQIPTSFGGLVFMLMSIGLLGGVIVLESLPARAYLGALQAGEPPRIDATGWIAFGLVVLLCVVVAGLPLRYAVRRLRELEA